MKKLVSILMVLVILALGTTVIAGASSAVVSPTKEDVWHISTKTVGDGDAASDKYSVVQNADETVTLTATDGTETFYKWTMEGQYTIIDGGLEGRVMTIMPASDIVATAYFSGGSSSGSSSTTSSGSTSSTSSGTNSSSTSPKTGSFTYAMILTLIALAAGGVAIVVSKKVRQK